MDTPVEVVASAFAHQDTGLRKVGWCRVELAHADAANFVWHEVVRLVDGDRRVSRNKARTRRNRRAKCEMEIAKSCDSRKDATGFKANRRQLGGLR